MRYKLSKKADDDFKKIYKYTYINHGERQADERRGHPLANPLSIDNSNLIVQNLFFVLLNYYLIS